MRNLPVLQDFLCDPEAPCCGTQTCARARIRKHFEGQIYGAFPQKYLVKEYSFRNLERDGSTPSSADVFEIELRVLLLDEEFSRFEDDEREFPVRILATVPSLDAFSREPRRALLGPNFYGNHSVTSNPQVHIDKEQWVPPFTKGWLESDDEKCAAEYRAWSVPAGHGSRGFAAARWPLGLAISEGYAVLTFYHGDLALDDPSRCMKQTLTHASLGRGALCAWAFGIQIVMDYLEEHDGAAKLNVDPSRVCAFGHSRNGKAALIAGAYDERIWASIGNCSGCMGAAVSRGKSGEDIKAIVTRFPHWFRPEFAQYSNAEELMPVDQHLLLALVSPRAVLICSAFEDTWADPRAELRSVLATAKLETEHGSEFSQKRQDSSCGNINLPECGTFVGSTTCAFHVRQGKHAIGARDFKIFIDFLSQLKSC
ncbi:Carbohydrate esterase [Porphyridium purpureum]|uniref:(4-O-methyl)-D-glucuronate--lignin esterase n=1 Tax=Porphyridium purpureum TaxID=35688 RepID=A0A5J4YM36_PORPP|nr:Carbohydrate esterase [Porphyridium purpureum]|eukprot:POR8168..scf295_9